MQSSPEIIVWMSQNYQTTENSIDLYLSGSCELDVCREDLARRGITSPLKGDGSGEPPELLDREQHLERHAWHGSGNSGKTGDQIAAPDHVTFLPARLTGAAAFA